MEAAVERVADTAVAGLRRNRSALSLVTRRQALRNRNWRPCARQPKPHLELEPDWNVLLARADASQEWICQTARPIESPSLSRSISAAALSLVESRYDWCTQSKMPLLVIGEVSERLPIVEEVRHFGMQDAVTLTGQQPSAEPLLWNCGCRRTLVFKRRFAQCLAGSKTFNGGLASAEIDSPWPPVG